MLIKVKVGVSCLCSGSLLILPLLHSDTYGEGGGFSNSPGGTETSCLLTLCVEPVIQD